MSLLRFLELDLSLYELLETGVTIFFLYLAYVALGLELKIRGMDAFSVGLVFMRGW